MTNILQSSMKKGINNAENLKEKPKYMLFSVFTVLVYEFSGFGWMAVLTWFFVNFIADYFLMKYEGEI